ncbi:MAG: hypothetical protein IPK16_15985 [Anaerolineales bacterium]|nr:hypothetical protein [Anaerolineales bacterium]
MNGPAVLVASLGLLLSSSVLFHSFSFPALAVGLIGWFVSVAIVFGAGRLLGGKNDYSSTLRVMGFARVADLVALFGLIPQLMPLIAFLTPALIFIGTWMGVIAAQHLKGWRAFLLPVAMMFVVVAVFIVSVILIGGAAMSLDSVLNYLGLPNF